MNALTRSITSGTAGAVVLTLLHEVARRRIPSAPRMDLMGMRAIRRMAPNLREPQMSSRDLHNLALAGDIVSNSLYYAAIPARSRRATWMRATALGAAAGLGALLVPEPIGLGPPPHSHLRSNQLMTVAWYLAGAFATAATASALD